MAEMVNATMSGAETADKQINQQTFSVDMSTLEPEDIANFRSLFDKVDLDHNGIINPDELQQLFKSLDIQVSTTQLESLIAIVDVDKNQQLSFEEFVTMICLLAANEDKEKQEHRDNLRVVFDSVDSDKSGSISTNELGEMFQTLGYEISPEEINQLIELVDDDKNGTLDFDEFVRLMDLFLHHDEN